MSEQKTGSAASKMTKRVPIAKDSWTIERTRSYFTNNIRRFKTINYIYVVSSDKKLLGAISLKELYRYPANKTMGSVVKKSPLIAVTPQTDREKVVYLAIKNNIKAVPVIDEKKEFLGVVSSDRILSILYEDTHKNILRIAGVHKHEAAFDSVLNIPLWISFKHRIPWLLIGVVGGVFSAQIIGLFEETLEKNIILAAFIPLVVYISDAVGTQMEAFIIRDLAFQPKFSFYRYFSKQFIVTTLIAAVCGTLLSLGAVIYYGDVNLALVLGLSLFAAVISAIFTGLLVPVGLYKLKVDPASASGPLATIIQDIVSVVIYFSIAARLL